MTKKQEIIKDKLIYFLTTEAKDDVIKIVNYSWNLKDFLWSLTDEMIRDIFVQIKKIDKYNNIKLSYWLKDLNRKNKSFNLINLINKVKNE